MGGAIAQALAKGTNDLYVSDPDEEKLHGLQKAFPGIRVTNSNIEASKEADMVIVAVKPWLIENVLNSMDLKANQVLVSVAAGITFDQLEHYAGVRMPMLRVVPNTAIAYMASMTLVASRYATPEQEQSVLGLFGEMGLAMPVSESQIPATMALTSCGIAFVLKYIQAAMQAGVEMGIYPKQAQRMVAQSVKGAAELILNNPDAHPSAEIDKVTTPGGLTIKGINELEHGGFTSAVIRAMKVCR